jgi:hypothetical protein
VFRYACLLADGEPLDPVVFVVAVPDWRVGDTFEARDGRTYRILDIATPPELTDDLNGVFTVEPV